jgi:hypothetical protein
MMSPGARRVSNPGGGAVQLLDLEVRDMLVASNVGWWLGGIVLFLIWIAIAFWPARVAARKGHSFFLFFLFSLVFFPLALLVAYLVRDRRR